MAEIALFGEFEGTDEHDGVDRNSEEAGELDPPGDAEKLGQGASAQQVERDDGQDAGGGGNGEIRH